MGNYLGNCLFTDFASNKLPSWGSRGYNSSLICDCFFSRYFYAMGSTCSNFILDLNRFFGRRLKISSNIFWYFVFPSNSFLLFSVPNFLLFSSLFKFYASNFLNFSPPRCSCTWLSLFSFKCCLSWWGLNVASVISYCLPSWEPSGWNRWRSDYSSFWSWVDISVKAHLLMLVLLAGRTPWLGWTNSPE